MGGGDAAVAPPPAAEPLQPPACMLDLLLPDTIISILKLLADTPASIVAFSLCCSQARQLCSDRNLWADLCRSLTDALPAQLRSVDWSPSAWGVGSHSELYVRLLHPYRPLLQQRVWHTAKMPPGQLLLVDVMPPLIVGRSVSYKTLQGDPIGHALFLVRLPTGSLGGGDPHKGKARVYCCACQPAESLPAEEKLNMHMARSGLFTGLLHARHLAPAQLDFLQRPPAAAQAGSDAAAGAAAAGQAEQQPPCAPSSGSSSGGGTPAHAAAVSGLSVSCTASCGNLYAELVARWRVAQAFSPHPAAAAAPAGPQQEDHTAFHSSRSSGGDGSSARSPSSSVLLLPEVEEVRITPWDLRWIVEELDIPADWRSHAVYSPFCPSPWLPQPAAQSAAVHASTAGARAQLEQHLSRSSSALAGSCGATAAAEGLTGVWRGSYGSHGVELVQLQLLQAPAGYDLLQQHGLAEWRVESFAACPPGVLLRSLLCTPGPVVHPSLLAGSDGGLASLGAAHAAVVWQGAAAVDNLVAGVQPVDNAGAAAVAADGDAAAGASHPSQQQQQQCDSQSQCQQQQQQQLSLLVGTKVTGDRNVPAGQVSFAVDLGSRSSAGAGQLLQLSPGTHSDVKLNAAGTRQLVVKERYRGLAQIADVYFQAPRVTPVELVVFADADCLGLVWEPPMSSFSLLHRLPALP